LEKLYKARLKTSDRSDKELVTLVESFFNSFNDDLNSPKALEILDKICTNVIDGSNLSVDNFVRVCRVLGIES